MLSLTGVNYLADQSGNTRHYVTCKKHCYKLTTESAQEELQSDQVEDDTRLLLYAKYATKEPFNTTELETDSQFTEDSQTYAKEQLGEKTDEAKILGLPWDKVEDTLAVTFSGDSHEATKRDVLRSLASIYDPLGVASPVTLVGKHVTDAFLGMLFFQGTESTTGEI